MIEIVSLNVEQHKESTLLYFEKEIKLNITGQSILLYWTKHVWKGNQNFKKNKVKGKEHYNGCSE